MFIHTKLFDHRERELQLMRKEDFDISDKYIEKNEESEEDDEPVSSYDEF